MGDTGTDDYQRHSVPNETLEKWQKTVDLMAAIFDVSAGLIMRVLPTQIEVLLASHSAKHPYEVGEKAELNTGLYCETVMASRKRLAVPNALEDPDWKDNPDVRLNMISYLGVPLICPDGTVFGTICVLDDQTREFLPLYTEMLEEFRGIIEQDLRMLQQQEALHDANQQLKHELAVARELSEAADREHRLWLLGNSIAVRALRGSIRAYADGDEPLLLTGENGAGHEAVARSIHRSSRRSDRPFIFVACPHVSTADETVIGIGAGNTDQAAAGKLHLADRGTLYLEGIESLPRAAQLNLLNALQDAADRRAAGQLPVPDVRIISYASCDLAGAVKKGEFDSRLYKLLSASRLAVPSLAERRDDIVALAERIVAVRSRSLGKSLSGLNAPSKERLLGYRWPGNVQELQNVIERAVVLATDRVVDIPEDLLREGRRIGGYTLQRRLGVGAMGEVWLARHSLLARPSAVKLIRHKTTMDDSDTRGMVQQRFQREAQATSQLRSPHTVELYDFGVSEEGDFYYVMEYLDGIDLQSLVANYGPVSPARAIFLLKQACLSLAEAHQAGLVHRDIKPANLFACRLGIEYDFVKLLDFGIVRDTRQRDQSDDSAVPWMGTPTTISPEAAQSEDTTPASDIYSLGCVAYWLLTGHNVFETPELMALLLKHITEPPKPPSDLQADIPEALNQLVLQCLAKDPADRPQSAIELYESLENISLNQTWGNEDAEVWWNKNIPSVDQLQSDRTDSKILDTIVAGPSHDQTSG